MTDTAPATVHPPPVRADGRTLIVRIDPQPHHRFDRFDLSDDALAAMRGMSVPLTVDGGLTRVGRSTIQRADVDDDGGLVITATVDAAPDAPPGYLDALRADPSWGFTVPECVDGAARDVRLLAFWPGPGPVRFPLTLRSGDSVTFTEVVVVDGDGGVTRHPVAPDDPINRAPNPTPAVLPAAPEPGEPVAWFDGTADVPLPEPASETFEDELDAHIAESMQDPDYAAAEPVRNAELDAARRLLAYAMHLRQYGERAPGGDETWAEWDAMAEAHLRATGWPAGERPPGADVRAEYRHACALCTTPGEMHNAFHDPRHDTWVKERRVVTSTPWERVP